jgi:signal transduction histidine kinase
MRSFTFAILLLSPAYAQQSAKDSLLAAIAAGQNDTVQVMRLYQYGQYFDFSSPDSAIHYYRRALALAERIGHVLGQVRFSEYMASPLDFLGRYDEKDSIINVGLRIAERYNLKKSIAAKYSGLANSAIFQRNNVKAVEYYLKALAIAEELNDSTFLAAFYNNLCATYKNLEDNDKAYEYGEKALAIHTRRGRRTGMLTSYINLGILDSRRGDHRKALQRHQAALAIGEELDDNETRITAWNNIGDCYRGLGKPHDALRSYRKSDSLCSQLNAPFYHFYALAGMGKSYVLLGNSAKAEQYYAKAKDIATKSANKDQLKTLYHEMSEMYEKQGNLRAALASYKLYEQLKDSVSGEEVKKNINDLQVRYETAKKEREILQKSIELQQERDEAKIRNILLGGISVLTLALLVILVQRHHLNKQKFRVLAAERELAVQRVREEERVRIASDMHDDLGAGLTSIKVLADIARQKAGTSPSSGDIERISFYAGDLVSKLSEIVWAMKTQNDSLENLVAYIRSYAAQFLSDAQITCRFHIPEDLPDVKVSGTVRRSVFLVVKEALNNMVKHSQATEAQFDVTLEPGEAVMIIRDNGVGLNAAAPRKHGTGMESMRQRMAALGGTFQIEGGNGTTVRLSLPLPNVNSAVS